MNQDAISPSSSKGTPPTQDRPTDGAESTGGHPDVNGAAVGNGESAEPKAEYPVADFLEPIGFSWTEEGFEARQAVKAYSEGTHADH
jgi:hypothetical protein